MSTSSRYIYSFADLDEGLGLLFTIDDVCKEWRETYPDYETDYQVYINDDKSMSVILEVIKHEK